MAEGSSSNTLLIVLVVGALAYFLLSKAQKTATSIGRSVNQVNSTVGAVQSIATSAAPALGSFLGNLLGGSRGSSAPSTASSAFSSDGLMEPNFDSSSSYSDDSFDFGSD